MIFNARIKAAAKTVVLTGKKVSVLGLKKPSESKESSEMFEFDLVYIGFLKDCF